MNDELSLDIITLKESYTGIINCWSYFRFILDKKGETRIIIKLVPGLGYLEIYGNNYNEIPTEENYTWCSGVFSKEDNIDKDFYTPDESTFINTNIFDKIVPRQFTRKSSNLSNYIKNTIKSNDPLILCIGSDEWEGILNPICSIAIKNINNDPIQYTIEKYEYYEHELLPNNIKTIKSSFERIFEDNIGEIISRNEIKKLRLLNNKEFTYGEIEIISIIGVFELCKPQAREIFWDLGCGIGKCLIAAGLLYPQLLQINGVEYIGKLYDKCKENLQLLDSSFPVTQVFHDDLLNVNWQDADIIYCTNLCFPQELNERLFHKCLLLKKGTRLILLKPLLNHPAFSLVYNSRIQMSWGNSQIYIIEKIE